MPSKEGPEPKAHSLPSCPAPPGTCPGLVGSVSKPTRRPFLAGLGSCLLHKPHPASLFPSSPLKEEVALGGGVYHRAFKPGRGGSSGALEQHGATRPRGSVLRKGFLEPLGDKPSSEGRLWPAKQVGVGAVAPEPTPTPMEHPWGQPNLSSFTNVQPALGNPSRTAQGLSDPFQVLRSLQMEKGADGGHHRRGLKFKS